MKRAWMRRVKGMAAAWLACMMLPVTGMASFAGQWEQGEQGAWSYRYHDGDLLKGGWYWIDGNLDGTAECYCFDARGGMYQKTVTPDGYTVNSSGAWIKDGVLQTRAVQPEEPERMFALATLDGGVLSNAWSDYRLEVPPGSDFKMTAQPMDGGEGEGVAGRRSCLPRFQVPGLGLWLYPSKKEGWRYGHGHGIFIPGPTGA